MGKLFRGVPRQRAVVVATLCAVHAAAAATNSCPATCQAYIRAPERDCDTWFHENEQWTCPRLEEAAGCDCRGCACGSDVINAHDLPAFNYAESGFSIHVRQFRSADPDGDPNPPVLFSVAITPEQIATNTLPDGYNGYTQETFEKYAWCGCSCAFEASRETKQETPVTTRFGDVGIAVLGRTWQLECCVDRWDDECSPAVGVTGSYVTCDNYRGNEGWRDAHNNTCAFYEELGLCAGGEVIENPAALDTALSEAQRNSSGTNWTTATFIADVADQAGTDAASACCWCGGGVLGSTYNHVCMDFFAENYYYGAYDGVSEVPALQPDDPPHGNVVDRDACRYALGCTNSSYVNYNSSALIDDMSCAELAFNHGARPRSRCGFAAAAAATIACVVSSRWRSSAFDWPWE